MKAQWLVRYWVYDRINHRSFSHRSDAEQFSRKLLLRKSVKAAVIYKLDEVVL